MKDKAGPIIGWSTEGGVVPSGEGRPIDALVDFPCVFKFKVVGDAGFIPPLLERVGKVIGRAITDDEHSVRASKKGNYTSVTLDIPVDSADVVYSIYAVIKDDERVRFVL